MISLGVVGPLRSAKFEHDVAVALHVVGTGELRDREEPGEIEQVLRGEHEIENNRREIKSPHRDVVDDRRSCHHDSLLGQ